MEELVRQISQLAQQAQHDIEEWRRYANRPNRSVDSVQLVSDTLEQIDSKLTSVHDHTSQLVERVPQDLDGILKGLKESILSKFTEVIWTKQTNRSNRSNHSNGSIRSLENIIASLTRQERQVFHSCFQSGFLTYRDLSVHLGITPDAAKNLVNRILRSDQKRQLFAKQYRHGSARVGIKPDLEKQILSGRKRKIDNHKRVKTLTVE